MSSRPILHLQNEITDPAGLFVEEFERRGISVETIHPYAGEPLPDSLDGYLAMVSGGGIVDTHQADEYPWLHHERELIASAVAGGTPYLGLCLGAQLLTEATGGRVYRCHPHEIGWSRVQLAQPAADDPLFGGLPDSFMAMQWHYYACHIPDSAVELAANPVCTQALRVGDHAWGTQFHIEVTRPILLTWLEMAEADLAENGYPAGEFLRTLDELLPEHMQIGRELARRFADVALFAALR